MNIDRPESNESRGAQNESEKDRADELQLLLTVQPLTLDMLSRPLLAELLDFYIAGVRARTHGDDLLQSMVNERNFDKICAHALMRILTTRIDKNVKNTVRRTEMRMKIQNEFRKILQSKKR